MIVDPELLREIDGKMVLIEEGDHSSDLAKLVRKTLEQESLMHSRLLETGESTRARIREKLEETGFVRRDLEDAWKFAVCNFNGRLDHDFIRRVASIVDSQNSPTTYRSGNVRVTGGDSVLAPAPEKIIRYFEPLLGFVNGDSLHAVEKAGLLHLHFARIHPLNDGNGRTARLLQNIILRHEGYAPATIRGEERLFYHEVLRCGLREYIHREGEKSFEEVWGSVEPVSPQERKFFGYIGSKVNIGLESQLTEVDRLPHFEIELSGKPNPGLVFSAKKILQGAFRNGSRLGQARIKDKRGVIDVKGEIDETTIRGILDRNYKGAYELTEINKGGYRVR